MAETTEGTEKEWPILRPATPEGWQAVDAAYTAVKRFPPPDQVTATAWAVVAVLSALRETSKDGYATRAAFNRTCDEALGYLQQQIAGLRFPTTRCGRIPVRPRRFLTLDATNTPRWVRLYVQPIGEQWVAMLVTEGAEPPTTGKLKGMGFFAETPAATEEMALRYVGRCTEQN